MSKNRSISFLFIYGEKVSGLLVRWNRTIGRSAWTILICQWAHFVTSLMLSCQTGQRKILRSRAKVVQNLNNAEGHPNSHGTLFELTLLGLRAGPRPRPWPSPRVPTRKAPNKQIKIVVLDFSSTFKKAQKIK